MANLEDFTWAMARQISQNSPISIAVMKEQLQILGNALPLSPEAFERIQGLRRLVYDRRDYLEGQRAFREKKKPCSRGSEGNSAGTKKKSGVLERAGKKLSNFS